MMNMQEQAAERVRRMQMMQDEAARRANAELTPKPPPQRQNQQAPRPNGNAEAQKSKRTSMPVEYLHQEREQHKTPQNHSPPHPASPAPLISGDQDSAMLLALILLLSRETSDPSLMLALMYIMM